MPKKIWNKENLQRIALKYRQKKDFKKGNINAYNSAIKKGILDEICTHMKPINKKWTYEKCREEANKYNTKMEFYKNSNASYFKAYRMGWLDDICSHMEVKKKKSGYWTYDRVLKESRKYNTRTEFYKGCSSAYKAAYNNNWLDFLFY